VSEPLGDRGRNLLEARRRATTGELEIYEKRGRSRRFERDALGECVSERREAGWAVRGGDRSGSWFLTGSGELPGALEPPPAGGAALELPEPREARPIGPGRGSIVPLATENEGRALLDGLARELARELPGARLVEARLDDGSSESALVSSRGVGVTSRRRGAALRVAALAGDVRIVGEFVAGSAAELEPAALARRLADRMTALGDAEPPPPAGSRLLLAAPLVARLVEALAPRLVGPGAEESWAAQVGGRGAAPGVTLVDDGAFAGGPMPAAHDGEGVPCGPARLVEGGRFARPLLAWWEVDDGSEATGCVGRPGWRDRPRRGPTQLYLAPDPARAVAELVAEGGASAYLLAVEGGVALHPDGRFEVSVSGFALTSGRAAGGLGRTRLVGSLGAWLRGVREIGRDLTFVPGRGYFGGPTSIVEGLELFGVG